MKHGGFDAWRVSCELKYGVRPQHVLMDDDVEPYSKQRLPYMHSTRNTDWLRRQHAFHWGRVRTEVVRSSGLPQQIGFIVADYYLILPAHRYLNPDQRQYHNLRMMPEPNPFRRYLGCMVPWLDLACLANHSYAPFPRRFPIGLLAQIASCFRSYLHEDALIKQVYSILRPSVRRTKAMHLSMLPHFEKIWLALQCIHMLIEDHHVGLQSAPQEDTNKHSHVPVRVLLCDWLVSIQSTVQHGSIDEVRHLLMALPGEWPTKIGRRECAQRRATGRIFKYIQ
jgi:hypothetical protein